MSKVNDSPAATGEETGAEDNAAHAKKHWDTPRLTRLDGRSALSGGGLASDGLGSS